MTRLLNERMTLSRVKSYGASLCPGLFAFAWSLAFFLYCRYYYKSLQDDVAERLFPNSLPRVLSGPFEGLRYYNRIVWGPITPKWLGTYELELHGIIWAMIAEQYAVILDIGAAEGYYAVGLARACPGARVNSYDIDFLARRRQRQLASLNRVPNLDIRKRCSHNELERVIADHCLVIADIEGFEVELLDPARTPSLSNADLLVECHRHESLSMEDVAGLLEQRFRATHRIERISMEPRKPEQLKNLIAATRSLPDDVVECATDEHRNYFQQWLWMRRHTAHPGGNA